MNIGMLWFDNSKDDLATRVGRAAEYYCKKYGQTPNLCFVNPAMITDGTSVPGIEIRTTKTMLNNHFWLGVRGWVGG